MLTRILFKNNPIVVAGFQPYDQVVADKMSYWDTTGYKDKIIAELSQEECKAIREYVENSIKK